MIHSILDNDLYKFSMMNAVMKLYPRVKVRYKFIDRGATYFPKRMVDKLKEAIGNMKNLYLTRNEKEFLIKKLYFFDPVYIDFLEGYRYNPDEVNIGWDDGELIIDIEGYWYKAILWEVPLMDLISELYFKNEGIDVNSYKIKKIHDDKAKNFANLGVSVADFGTRRRFSYQNQYNLVDEFKRYKFFVGTSNVHLAHVHNIKPIGTVAHEWFMFHAAKYGFRQANSTALGRWVDVYHGDLGIALTDTFTTDVFLRSFDTLYAKLFDGVRQDSGDPVVFGRMVEDHYRNLGIDPMTKTVVFSDGLNIDKVIEIENSTWKERRPWDVKRSYGIGTYLTNDISEIKPLNIVIKMSAADPDGTGNWIPTIKLSDDKGKNTGDKKTIELAKTVLNI